MHGNRRILFIVNPQANRGRNRPAINALQAEICDRDGCQLVFTVKPGHAADIARDATGYDVVTAVGGDGTVHEVVNGLLGRSAADTRPALGVLPLGSGNDFVFGAGIAADWRTGLDRLWVAEPKSIDAGILSDGTGRSVYWGNTVGIGFDANVTLRSRRIRRIYGFAMYLTATLQAIMRDYTVYTLELEMDGRRRSQRVLMLTLGNGPREGGGFNTTPGSRMDDGVLEYLTFSEMNRARMLALLPKVLKGAHLQSPLAVHGQFHSLTLRSDKPLPVHCDGEIFASPADGVHQLQIRILPAALRVIV